MMCPKCFGPMTPIAERKDGFSVKKGIIGSLLVPGGILWGATGKKKVTYQCTKCGYMKEK